MEWFGSLPPHGSWQAVRLKRLVKLRGLKREYEEGETYVGLENIEPWTGCILPNKDGALTLTTSEDTTSIGAFFKVGDVLFSKLRPYLAKAFVAEGDGLCSTELLVLQPGPAIYGRFLLYLLLTPGFIDLVNSSAFGSKMPRAEWDFIGDIPMPLPPLRQQQHLAALLDRETARLDQLVAAKQEQLELIAEKRRALITRAVTQGLDEAAPRRETGLPWLGQVPVGWEVVPLKYLGNIKYGISQPPEYTSEGIPFLRATNVTKGIITEEGLVYVAAEVLNDPRAIKLKTGDIIVVRSGAYTGDSAMITKRWTGAIAGFDMVFRTSHRTHAAFIALALLSQYVLEAQIDPLRVRAAQPHLNAEELGSALIALPPLAEQREIIARFNAQSEELEAVRKYCQKSIGLMHERRAALIAAAVTGKLDLATA